MPMKSNEAPSAPEIGIPPPVLGSSAAAGAADPLLCTSVGDLDLSGDLVVSVGFAELDDGLADPVLSVSEGLALVLV
jgi:hypothetical protein